MNPNAAEALIINMSANISTDGEFAETATLTKKSTGATRVISCIVDRVPPDVKGSDGRTTAPKMLVTVRNDSTYGYASSEIDGRDTLTIAYRIGGAVVAYPIKLATAAMGNQNEATLLLELD